MAQIPKGRYAKGLYKPRCRDCAIYFSNYSKYDLNHIIVFALKKQNFPAPIDSQFIIFFYFHSLWRFQGHLFLLHVHPRIRSSPSSKVTISNTEQPWWTGPNLNLCQFSQRGGDGWCPRCHENSWSTRRCLLKKRWWSCDKKVKTNMQYQF